jgi:uncharacterized protein
MTTLKAVELICPVGKDQFTSRIVASRIPPGGARRTDFYPASEGVRALPFLVHMCERCGFAGNRTQFEADASIGPLVEQRVWNELTPRLSGAPPTASEKYEFAARVAQWLDDPPQRVAELWLRAAWSCVDEGDVEAERYYRRHAVWQFEEALAAFEYIPRDDRAAYTYLVGELWRRIGDTARARSWFDRVPDEITKPAGQQWVLFAAKQQQESPREWFS